MHYSYESDLWTVPDCWTISLYWTNLTWNPLTRYEWSIAGVRKVFTLRFCRATLNVWPFKRNIFLLCKEMVKSFVTNIISCPWHLLASIWKYSVIFIIADMDESLAIWSIHKLLEYRSYLNTEPTKTNQSDPKPATIYPNTTGLRDICIDDRLWCCVTITLTIKKWNFPGLNVFFTLKLSRKVKACSLAENRPADIFLQLKLMSSQN